MSTSLGTVIPLSPRTPPASPVGINTMRTLHDQGRKVRMRLVGPLAQRLGPWVIGWRANRITGPVYICWDRFAKAHIEITPIGWLPLDANPDPHGTSKRAA